MNKYLYFILGVVLFTSIVSANGLQVSNSTITINKTVGEIKNFTIILSNQEPFTFTNISFQDDSKLSMQRVNSLASGSNVSIIVSITGSNDFSGPVRIKGYYNSTLATLNETHTVNVSYETGLSSCNQSITKGDSIVWNNLINSSSGTIKLLNAQTGAEIASIPSSSSHTEVFSSPVILNYYFTRLGFQFTETCTITVLDTQGLINNPDLDAIINLNLDVLFIPTTLSLETFDNSYTIIVGTTASDILRVTNTGTNTGKLIHLSGDWFTFSDNDFDLSAGQSRNIAYTITPILQSVNDTNKTYLKTISVSGNFDTVVKNFSILIPFSDIGNFSSTSGIDLYELFKERAVFVQAYCNSQPDDPVCRELFRGSSGSSVTNQNSTQVTQQQFLEFVKGVIEFIDRNDKQNNINKEQQANITIRLNNLENNSNQTLTTLNSINKNSEDSLTNPILIASTFLTIALLAIFWYIIAHKRKMNKFDEFNSHR